jgi:uncharacterized protein YbbK (DUF523 family)
VNDRPRVGISSCLLGETVRWNGGHKRDAYLADVLGEKVEWVPVCPEVEAGFGTPREPMELVRVGGTLVLVTVTTRRDVTDQLRRLAVRRVEQLAGASICGYVLKKRSPSCGLEPVPGGRGLFADALLTRLPRLPVVEEDRLSDPALRERFLARVLAYQRQMSA